MVRDFHINKATKFTVLFDRLFLKYTVARMGPIGAANKLLPLQWIWLLGLQYPVRELTNSMPVPCATLDQVQCQRLDPVPYKTQDQFGPILGIGPTTFPDPVPCGTQGQFGPILGIGLVTFLDPVPCGIQDQFGPIFDIGPVKTKFS